MENKEKVLQIFLNIINTNENFKNIGLKKIDRVVFADMFRKEIGCGATLCVAVIELEKREGGRMSQLIEYYETEGVSNLVNHAKFVKDIANKHDVVAIVVDDNGLGKGLKDALRPVLLFGRYE